MKTLIKQLLREELTAYHRSPNIFNKFATSKIGSGSGRKWFGWGLYFSDSVPPEEYGDSVYKVTLFKGKDLGQYTLIDLRKPLEKELFIKIIYSLYKYKNEYFDINSFNLYYDKDKKLKELKKILWAELRKIDPNLEHVSLSEMMDVENKDSWFYITNYTENNKRLKNLFDEITSLSKLSFNDYGFNVDDYGSLIYDKLANVLGSDKNASLFLLNNGIDGLKTNHGGRTNDYIIFDENAVTIEKNVDNQQIKK
jgi:hypothetical protein